MQKSTLELLRDRLNGEMKCRFGKGKLFIIVEASFLSNRPNVMLKCPLKKITEYDARLNSDHIKSICCSDNYTKECKAYAQKFAKINKDRFCL